MATVTKYITFFDKNFGHPNAGRDGHFSYIEECIAVAIKNNGKVFGGFVRDVIHPLSKGVELKTLDFKDIDIWFTTDSDATSFVSEMGTRVIQNDITGLFDFKREGFYKFGRTHYHLYHNEVCIAWMDVVVSDEVPVDDFDVNTLCYNGGPFAEPLWYLGPTATSSEIIVLVNKMTDKKMTIKDSFVTRLVEDRKSVASVAQARLYKFLRQGWKIVAIDPQGEEVPITLSPPIIVVHEGKAKIVAAQN